MQQQQKARSTPAAAAMSAKDSLIQELEEFMVQSVRVPDS